MQKKAAPIEVNGRSGGRRRREDAVVGPQRPSRAEQQSRPQQEEREPGAAALRKRNSHKHPIKNEQISSKTNKRFQRGALPAQGHAVRADSVWADCGGNDEHFGGMDHERRKRLRRTFHNRFRAFHQVQNIDRAVRVVRHNRREPVATRFNELQSVRPGAPLAPARAGAQRLHAVDQIGPRRVCVMLLAQGCPPVAQVDGARHSVQPEAAPFPQLMTARFSSGRGLDTSVPYLPRHSKFFFTTVPAGESPTV